MDEEGGYTGGEDGVYTETETEGFFGRLGDSFAGICIGLLLFIGAFPLLWWNEGRAVDTYNAIKEGRKIYVPVSASPIDSLNEGSLVYVTGLAEPTDNITDVDFGVEVSSKTSLSRTVEMYQWQENKTTKKKKNVGGSTTTVTEYTYSKVWSDRLIDSSAFKQSAKHQNPGNMPYSSSTFYPSAVILGDFTLPTDLIDYISTPSAIGGTLDTDLIPDSNALSFSFTDNEMFSYPNGFYFGNTTTTPYVGHTRVTYQAAPGGVVSILAEQEGSTFGPYEASSGAELYRLEQGVVGAEAMFDNAKAENKAVTMVLRIVGAMVMSIGIGLVLQPLEVVADIIPCIGDLVGAAVSCVAGLIGITLSLIVIGIAWVANRPIILGVGAAGALVVGGLVYMGYKRKQNAPQKF